MEYQSTTIWAVILGVGIITYALRSSFLLFTDLLDSFPPSVERALRFVPIAVLAALILPRLLFVGDSLTVGLENARLVAGVVAFGIAWYTESRIATVCGGFVVFWVLQ